MSDVAEITLCFLVGGCLGCLIQVVKRLGRIERAVQIISVALALRSNQR